MIRTTTVSIAIALVSSAVLGVLALGSAPRVVPTMDADAANALAAGDLRAEWAALHTRASTLAQLPRLGAAIATDAATVRDLTSDELAFRVHPGESIELAQVVGDQPHSLLRLPESAAPLPLVAGTTLTAVGGSAPPFGGAAGQGQAPAGEGELVFTDAVAFTGTGARGVLAVAQHATPSTVFTQLIARTNARARVGGQTFALGAPLAADANTIAVQIAVGDSQDTVVTLELPAARQTTAAAIGLGVASALAFLIAIGLLVASALRARGRSALPIVGKLGMPAITGRLPIARGDDSLLSFASESVPLAVIAEATGSGPVPLDPAAPLPTIAATTRATTEGAASSSTRLGRYEPVSLLGEGATSSVFLARSLGEEGFERRVALKVLRADLSRDTRFREMFLDEARLASRIEHPNVVQIFDLGRAGDELFIAMEHIDGGDLEAVLWRQRCAKRRTPLPIALTILRRLCDGLHAAHTAVDRDGAPLHLVHRDVKPANVLISRNGEVKIGDFGIVKATQQVHRTGKGETKGTVQFMAPEQRMGRDLDGRADVFGVAAIGYEMITGVELDLDLQRMVERGLDGWPHLQPIAVTVPDAPPELEQILLAALAYEADGRPESCAVLEAQLAEIVARYGWTVSRNEIATWMRAELDRHAVPAPAARAS